MKTIKIGFYVLALFFTSCENLVSDDLKLFSEINKYYQKVNNKNTKDKFAKLFSNTVLIGDKKLNVAEIVDDITAETGKYLNDISELLSASETKNSSANTTIKKSFSLYKKMVEEDIPKLVSKESKSTNTIKLDENELSKIILEMKEKQGIISNDLHNIKEQLLQNK